MRFLGPHYADALPNADADVLHFATLMAAAVMLICLVSLVWHKFPASSLVTLLFPQRGGCSHHLQYLDLTGCVKGRKDSLHLLGGLKGLTLVLPPPAGWQPGPYTGIY